MTWFLQLGERLDNNICERALKKAILFRKNSLFYKSPSGARVGDLYMSLIYTSELNGGSPFNHLTRLQERATDVVTSPDDWLPWNYGLTVGIAGSQSTAA